MSTFIDQENLNINSKKEAEDPTRQLILGLGHFWTIFFMIPNEWRTFQVFTPNEAFGDEQSRQVSKQHLERIFFTVFSVWHKIQSKF